MNDTGATRAVIVVIVGAALGGCAKKPPPNNPTPPVAPQMAADPEVRVATLARLADAYARLSNELPGETDQEHRRLMARVFAQLREILPNLRGPGAGAEFRIRLQQVADSQSDLSGGPSLAPEVAIDTGLRAARDALQMARQSSIYDDADLGSLFDQLTQKVNELDTVRGPLHQVVAGETVGVTSQIISKMSDALGRRLAQERAIAERSSSQPATQP